jgi:4,5-dihydroxyphthalate decarboxylase
MGDIELTLACTVTDRTRPFFDGSVGVPGCRLILRPAGAEEIFRRAMADEFDVTEMSMATHILRTARGDSSYVGIPVFLSRAFRHSAIYIRNDRGISRPADLKGKTVGLREYQQTAALWVRGFLGDDYGVDARSVIWRTGGLEAPGGGERIPLKLPADLNISPISRETTLNGLLVSGELDAIISAGPPSCFVNGGTVVDRLFPDYQAAEVIYFQATGFFPIMHCIVIRKEIANTHPWIARALFHAFAEAKALSLRVLDSPGVLHVSLPWLVHHFKETQDVLGKNYWSYGFEKNRRELDAMVRYAVGDGLACRHVDPKELFHMDTLAIEDC